jgi:hypothetical protein
VPIHVRVWLASPTAVGIRCADHATPIIRKKVALTSPTSGGRSVGTVRLRTKNHGFFLNGSVILHCNLEILILRCGPDIDDHDYCLLGSDAM